MEYERSLFEGDHKWEIEVSGPEIFRVHAMMRGIAARKDGRNVVWVRNMGGGTRRWYCEGYMTRAYVDALGGASDPVDPVTIPMEFLPTIEDLVQEHDSAVIFLNEEDNVITCRAGDEYAVIDAPTDPELGPTYTPRLQRTTDLERDATATVKSSVLERIASTYRQSAMSVKDLKGMTAFTTLAFDRDCMRWTNDWTRWGKSATSGMCAAVTSTHHPFSVRFYPSATFSFFDCVPLPEDVQIVVDDCHHGAPGFVTFLGDDFGIVVKLFPEGLMRYDWLISPVLGEFGFEAADTDETEGELEEFMRSAVVNPEDVRKLPVDWELYSNGDVSLFVEVVPGTAGHDCIRLSHHIGDPVPVTVRLMKELSYLNSELVNARLVVSAGGFVSILVDVDNPRDPDQMRDAVTNMLAAIGSCDGFEQFLPLFATDEDPDEHPDDD